MFQDGGESNREFVSSLSFVKNISQFQCYGPVSETVTLEKKNRGYDFDIAITQSDKRSKNLR